MRRRAKIRVRVGRARRGALWLCAGLAVAPSAFGQPPPAAEPEAPEAPPQEQVPQPGAPPPAAPGADEQPAAAPEPAEDAGEAPAEPAPEGAEKTEPAPPEAAPEGGEAAPPEATPPVEQEEEFVPLAEPPPTEAAPETGKAPAREEPKDEILYSGYLPGYRRHLSLGSSPYGPHVGALPGGVTGGYGSPVPPSDWTFTFSGYMTASLQFSTDYRRVVGEGQHETVFHTPPETVDTYAYFTSTNTVPGNWVSMRFKYGNPRVSANLSIDTYNPTRPTTYYQIGSQYFINNAYLSYTPEALFGVRLRFDAGRFNSNYGTLGQYGAGVYVNPLSGGPTGIGERLIAEYDLSETYTLVVEHGLMGRLDGKVPDNVVRAPETGWRRPLWPASWVHHAHAGIIRKGEPQLELQLHYLTNWSQEDRTEQDVDDRGTRAVDESNLRDGRISVFGADAKLTSGPFGLLGIGAAYIRARDSYPLKGLVTYGGDGEQLTERYLGVDAGGSGELFVFAVNYQGSIGKIVSYPQTFDGQGPDIVINTGFHWTKTRTDFANFDGRIRYKFAFDALYTFLRNVGAGARVDRVAPNSFDSEETFYVLAPRVQFKTDWTSRENITLLYAKWFYGERTRNEGTGERDPERLDDELFALNFNMWW